MTLTLTINASTAATATGRRVAFTTPNNYAARVSQLLTLRGHTPLWCPTLTVHPTPQSLHPHLSPPPSLDAFSAVAFTSRAGISAFSDAMAVIGTPLLSPVGHTFAVAAMGRDAELLDEEFLFKVCSNLLRVKKIVPPIATPRSLVESLGPGSGRRVLCPVPLVVGVEEPPVVPDFLQNLETNEWVPVRATAYETRWIGPQCAEPIMKEQSLDAVVFTSTAEVEGLLKSLSEFGWAWDMVRKKWPELLVAAHGPVTAAGAERLGVRVDIVSSRFDSFEGVVHDLDSQWQTL